MSRIRRGLAIACAAATLAPFAAAERSGDQGYGLMVGNPSGFSAKVWMDETIAFDAAIGVARSELDLHLTLLLHKFDWYRHSPGDGVGDRIRSRGDFPIYFGVGPRMVFEHKEELGIRFPVGLSFLPFGSDWEFFGELAPVLRLTPDTGFNGDFAIGARYYFRTVRPRIP